MQQGGTGANGATETSAKHSNEEKKVARKSEKEFSIKSDPGAIVQSESVDMEAGKFEQLTSNQGEIALNVNMREQV